MATKYYALNTNADTLCDYATGTPYDLATSTGTPTTHTVDTSGISSWQTVLTYDINIGGGLMAGGDTINFSISLNTVTNSDVRLWIQYVDVSCVPSATSTAPYSTTWTTSGVKTGSLTMSSLGGTPIRFRLLVDAQRNLNHGTRNVIVDVESTSTYIEGPWGGAGPTVKTGSVL
jgi:hypothetical protein